VTLKRGQNIKYLLAATVRGAIMTVMDKKEAN
jgi:hypothetical protein